MTTPTRLASHRLIGLAVALAVGIAAALGVGGTRIMHSTAAAQAPSPTPGQPLPVERVAPPLDGAVAWLNSAPLGGQALRGKVVLVDFWTYTCINCLRALPYVQAWADKYRAQGLVVVGVHTPEFEFEQELANVRRAVTALGIRYPVAVDSKYRIWQAFDNHYWPAHYFIDAQGRIRHHHFGEGNYAQSEQVIRDLLGEAGHAPPASPFVTVSGSGAQLAPDLAQIGSPETYLGYARAERFASSGGMRADRSYSYTAPSGPALNRWGLGGRWRVGAEQATLLDAGGRIVFRFHARDLHLVLGPGADDKPVRFIVRLDGAAPGPDHGVDCDADGRGTVTSQRLYQLIRSSTPVGEHTFEIEFLDPQVQAFAFTFG